MTEAYDPSQFPPFAVTVDLAVFTLRSGRLHVLLIERGEEPFLGRLALPGGFLRPDEDAGQAARRELTEETGLALGSPYHLEQLRTYSGVARDPRMRVVTVAYVAFAPDLPDPVAAADARAARWVDLAEAQAAHLAFDHGQILDDAVERVRAKLEYTTIATRFLPRQFAIGQLRAVYQAVWGEAVELQNFRRKVLSVPGFIEPVGQVRTGVPGPPARLYKAGPATAIDPPFSRARAPEPRKRP
ncbi:MAG: NUDIX hydrolase [Bifidobacteriaceae bacterium]|jgi:8-oxo-dGTP diphosphatase|nr:NUDIX hydrolase [Bifidobacteriaceae bacterium]